MKRHKNLVSKADKALCSLQLRKMHQGRALVVLLLSSAAHAFVPLGSRALAPAARGVPRRDASACAATRVARRSLVVVEAQPSAPSLEGFDQGGAEPVASVATLDSLVPRTKITELVKQTSDAEGAKQVMFPSRSLCAWRRFRLGDFREAAKKQSG